MDNFEQSELIGRDIYRKFITQFDGVKNYYETPNKYDVYDAGYTYNEQDYIIEIKYRNYKHNHFSTWLLEQEKSKALFNIAEGKSIHYVNIFTDGTLLIWNLRKLPILEAKSEMHVKTTAEESVKKQKEVYHLPTSLAKKFNY